MAKRYEVVEKLVSIISLPDYLRAYTELKRSGDHSIGKCPFHDDSTASFHVYSDHFHCYGCGKHGGVIDYEMHRNGASYREAVIELAGRYSVDIGDFDANKNSNSDEVNKKKSLTSLMEMVSLKLNEILLSPVGKPAVDYLEKRGISLDHISAWKLGFWPADDLWEKYFKGQGISHQDLELLGLRKKSSKAGSVRFYDFFYDRVIIPITDERGRCTALAGRIFKQHDSKDIPKFLNSPESILYSKSKVLFNFDKARASIVKTGEVIIVEGYMDCMTLVNSGVENVVAVSGTALTLDHVKKIARLAKKIIVCFDSDKAGKKASLRVFENIFPMNLCELFYIAVPDGKDPDEYVRRSGAAAFFDLLLQKKSLLAQVLENLKSMDLSREGLIREAKASVVATVLNNPDKAQQEVALSTIAVFLGLSDWRILVSNQQVESKIIRAGATLAPQQINDMLWDVKSALEVKIVVASCSVLLTSPTPLSVDYSIGVLSLFKDAWSKSLISESTFRLLEEIFEGFISGFENTVQSGIGNLYEGFSRQFRVLAAIIVKDRITLNELGLDYWSFERCRGFSLISNVNVFLETNVSFINLCVEDARLSLSRGAVCGYIDSLCSELKKNLLYEQMWSRLPSIV